MHVEIRGVTRRFGPLKALDDVSIDFASASKTALVGPNGSGKSTLVRVMTGLLQRDGEVRIDGLDPVADRRVLAPRVAYISQVAPRLQATVRELTRAIARLRCMSTTPIVEIARELNLDMEAIAKKPFRTLSGGMRQKLLGAFALGVGAELLVLDEPTASLDADSRERFFDLVQRLDPQPTLLLCSHRFEEIRSLVDDVAALEDGRLVYHGRVDSMIAASGRSVIELRPQNGCTDPYLVAQGFVRRGTGWWHAIVPSADRGSLVTRISSELGPSLADIVVRDVEESLQRRNGQAGCVAGTTEEEA